MLGSEALVREALATEALATEALATEAPATKALATKALATKALATEALATEALATEAPAKTAPAREALARIQTLRQVSKRKSRTWQSTMEEYSKRLLMSAKGEQARMLVTRYGFCRLSKSELRRPVVCLAFHPLD